VALASAAEPLNTRALAKLSFAGVGRGCADGNVNVGIGGRKSIGPFVRVQTGTRFVKPGKIIVPGGELVLKTIVPCGLAT